MSITGIQGQPLEVTVVACSKLRDTEWISRQDPYVCLEYGSTKFRTRTCTDGGKNPVFQEKFVFSLIEGLRELNVVVWNSNTITLDDLIGSGKIQLHKVLSQGFDDSAWPLQTKTGRYAGEVKLILHYAIANHKKSDSSYAPSAPPYVPPATPQVPLYSAPSSGPATSYPPPPSVAPYLPTGSAPAYPPVASTVSYPPPATAYPSPSPYPSHSSAYPPSSYPASFPYPPSSYPASSPYPSFAYPPSSYPPPPSYPPTSAYPPPPYPPPAGYPPGIYRPPPY